MLYCSVCSLYEGRSHFSTSSDCFESLTHESKIEIEALNKAKSPGYFTKDVRDLIFQERNLLFEDFDVMARIWGSRVFQFEEEYENQFLLALLEVAKLDEDLFLSKLDELIRLQKISPFDANLSEILVAARLKQLMPYYNAAEINEALRITQSMNYENPLVTRQELAHGAWFHKYKVFEEYKKNYDLVLAFSKQLRVPTLAVLEREFPQEVQSLKMRASRLVHHPESIPDALKEIGWEEYFESSLPWGDIVFGMEAIGDLVFPVNRGHDTLANKLIRLISFEDNGRLLHILADHDWVEQIVNLNAEVRNNPSNPFYMKLALPKSDQKNTKSYVQVNWRNRLKRRN